MSWIWPMLKVPKTTACRYRVWLGTLPLQLLPNGGRVELRMHLKQWDETAADPHSWCINITKYAEKAPTIKRPKASMDPYNPLQQLQISERDWPAWFAQLAPDVRHYLERHIPEAKAKAPPIQSGFPTSKEDTTDEPRAAAS